MYRLNNERVLLDLDGPSVEVEPILSWAIQQEALRLWRSLGAAESGSQAEYDALAMLAGRFTEEAMPTWDFADHRGPVPASARGFMRLPVDTQTEMLKQWIETANPKASAVDAIIPDGPANREIKRRLKSVRKAA